MNLKKAWLAIPAAAALALTACAGGGGSATTTTNNGIVLNGSEPQNALLPGQTSETGGGRILTAMFSQLVRYEADGTAVLDVAESIEPNEDNTLWTVKLHQDRKFSDGTPVKAENFTRAWNLITSQNQKQASFFDSFDGTNEEGVGELTGVQVVDDYTFTIKLKNPAYDLITRLGYTAYAPLPNSTLDDPDKGGQVPVGNGPYKLASDDAWEHNVKITLVPNENYVGDEKPQNEGVTFVFYNSMDAAYNDLKAGNVDVLDAVPSSAMASYQQTFAGTSVNEPYAGIMTLTIPQYLDHFKGEEGKLRRQAISMAINRDEITSTIYAGARTPAKDFTAPTLPGYSDSLPGSDVLTYNETKAKELWAQADAIAPWDGTFQIAYNSDGGHKEWVDAAANSIKNTLNIDAQGKAIVDFKTMLQQEDDQTIGAAFRSGWQGDYPSIYNFLQPLYVNKAASNKGEYSNPEFDALITKAAGATNAEEATAAAQQAQEILLQDLPVIPLWYYNVNGAWSKNVTNVTFDWRGQPVLTQITKNASK